MPSALELLTMVAAASAATVALVPPRGSSERRTLPTPSPVRAERPDVAATERPETGQAAEVVEEAPAELWVLLLGPVAVRRGVEAVDLTPRQLELTAFLATHRAGATEDQIRCALWGDRPSTSGAFRNLLWQTRRRLGSIDGEAAVLPVGSDHRYRLHPAVRCDLDLFEDTPDVQGLQRALAEVRGRPVDSRRGFDWAYREGIVGAAEQQIIHAAHSLATIRLDEDDVNGALAALAQGLVGCPGDEILQRERLRAYGQAGNRDAVERVIGELLASLETDDVELLAPETLELYRRYGRGDRINR
jgi:DNA-binding SARP family transcriptional activator